MRLRRVFGFLSVVLATLLLATFPAVSRTPAPGGKVAMLSAGKASLTHYRRGARPNPRAPADTSYGLAVPGQPIFVDGYYEYNTADCSDAGPPLASVATPPTHGSISFQTVSFTPDSGPCPGYTFQFLEAFYTWTDTTSGATEDDFAISWYYADGSLYGTIPYSESIDATEPDKQAGNPTTDGSCPCGDPISIGIGNVYESVTDYQTEGANRLAFTRSYNSMGNPSTLAVSLGLNWRSNFDRYLQITQASGTPSAVMVERGDGEMLQFTTNGTSWVSDSDVDISLVQSGSTWTLTDHSDTVETYTQISPTTAIITAIKARGGYTQTLAYNSSNQLVSVTDLYGRRLAFTYAGSLLQTVATPDGQTITYGYTPVTINGTAGNVLTSVSYPTSPVTSTTYLYEDSALPAALTGIMDENGNLYSSWTYDSYGRGLTSQHGGGADLTTVTYNDNDGSRLVTNALGEQNLYQFTILQGVPKLTEIDRENFYPAASELFTYDANGYLASQTDWNGNLTSITNNARGEPTSVVEASGTRQARTTATSWAANYHVPTEIKTEGLDTFYRYDATGNRTTREDKDTAGTRVWSYVWRNALLSSVTGPRTDVTQTTTFSYNKFGNLASTTDALGHTTRILTTAGGRPLAVVDPNGVETAFTYDARLRLVSSDLITAAGRLITYFKYDAAGNLLSKILPDKSFVLNTYDTAHRLIATTDALKNSLTYTLDAMGDKTQTVATNAGGTVTWQDQATFDALGREIQDQRGAGQTTYISYDSNGNVVSIIDPLYNTTQKTYDGLNRVTLVQDPAGGSTSFTYDAHDRLLAAKAANGALTSYAYDGFGRLLKRVSPDTGTTTYTYDPADNLLSSLDAAGVVTNRSYDALNRPTTVTYPADARENVAYTYDQAGHGFGIGRLTSLTDAAGSVSYSYDERGNELSEARVSGSVGLTTQYSYDAVSRVAGIAYPSGTTVLYGRNGNGQVISLQAKPPGTSTYSTIASHIAYEPFGPMTALRYGNNLAEGRTYDGDYRLTGITTTHVQALTYSYDQADNVSSVTDRANSANNQSFDYDTLYHLADASGAYGYLSWSYDLVGNRLTSSNPDGTYSSYSYTPHSNVLRRISNSGSNRPTSLSYTAIGNTAGVTSPTGVITAMAYNQTERLASVTIGGSPAASYSYDAFGRRFSKASPTATSLFQYDPAGHLLEEADGTGAARTDTIYLNGNPIADITPSTGALYFLHTDRLGTPQVATTTQQAIAWRAAYQPFGTNTGAKGLFTQNLRFPGQYADAETGLYQNGFRDYVPGWGRYLESDPIGLAGGANTYGYGLQEPLTLTDPTGLNPFGRRVGSVFGRWLGRFLGGAGGEAVDPLGGGIPGEIIGGQVGDAVGGAVGDAISDELSSTQGSAEEVGANKGGQCTDPNGPSQQETYTRNAPGADGSTSQQTITTQGDSTISRTHTVTDPDGNIIHQHTDSIGDNGGVRQFPDDWTGIPTIDAPYTNTPPNFGPGS